MAFPFQNFARVSLRKILPGEGGRSIVPEGHSRVARRLNAGFCRVMNESREGRLNNAFFSRPSRDSISRSSFPGVQTPGYSHPSLRDKTRLEQA